MSIEGSSDTISFGLYMREILAPRLVAGQIVVMDNLSVHKSKWVRDVKNLIRKAKARTLEALFEATRHALSAVTHEDTRGYFEHCGYKAPRGHSI